MNMEDKKWISEARRSIASHERNITAALYRTDYTKADRLSGYRDSLVRAIAKLQEAE